MITFDDRGLVTVVVQDEHSKSLLMVAHMNREALDRTLAGPHVWFYSRSRNELWEKGATSGNYLKVVEVTVDCDGDALLVTVLPEGPACHTGAYTCFQSSVDSSYEKNDRFGPGVLQLLSGLIHQRALTMPAGSYTSKLLTDGASRIAQKVIEEAGETGLAAATGQRDQVASEMSDLLYHCLVLLESAKVPIDDVWTELSNRKR